MEDFSLLRVTKIIQLLVILPVGTKGKRFMGIFAVSVFSENTPQKGLVSQQTGYA